MDDLLIDPRAPATPRKQRDVEAERHKKEVNHFYESHPLSRMYTAFQYMVWAREDRNWIMVGMYANALCSAYANLSEADKTLFAEALPNPPDYLGESSSRAWIAYLCSLIASLKRRERLGEAVRSAIVGRRGENFLPPVYRSLSAVDITECPF
jgi:hypothetical protein